MYKYYGILFLQMSHENYKPTQPNQHRIYNDFTPSGPKRQRIGDVTDVAALAIKKYWGDEHHVNQEAPIVPFSIQMWPTGKSGLANFFGSVTVIDKYKEAKILSSYTSGFIEDAGRHATTIVNNLNKKLKKFFYDEKTGRVVTADERD